jgi:pyruvate kinase
MDHKSNTKIIATLGPSSSSPEVVEALIRAGVNVFRLNFSHGTHDDHRTRFETVRAAQKRLGLPVAILQDLQGPKFRIGTLVGGAAELVAGARFTLDTNEAPGDAARAPLRHHQVYESLAPGNFISIDDGRIRLRVEGLERDKLFCRVVTGGILKDRKGVNLPGVDVKISALTDKDRQDILVGRELGVDWVALSFVQQPSDVLEARGLVDAGAWICSKIEKPAALRHLADIVALSDAVMIARGDLGVELPADEVPGYQRDILAACRRAGCPAIVATQMLESMISTPTPTRAEASDVANAVFAGADAVMLSAESASGQYPIEAVEMMAKIIASAERHPDYRPVMLASRPALDDGTIPHAVAASASRLAEAIGAKTIVAFTSTGKTVERVSRERPQAQIVAVVPNHRVAARSAPLWGVRATVIDATDFDAQSLDASLPGALKSLGITVPAGEPVVVVAGLPFWQPGSTNLIKVWTADPAHRH